MLLLFGELCISSQLTGARHFGSAMWRQDHALAMFMSYTTVKARI